MEQWVASVRCKDRYFDFNMIDQSKWDFRKSKKNRFSETRFNRLSKNWLKIDIINIFGVGPLMGESIVIGNNWPKKTTDIGKMCPQNQFFGFKSEMVYGFWRKNLKTVFTPFSTKKGNIHSWRAIPSKIVMPPNIICHSYFGKYCFFRQNQYMKSIQNVNAYKKGYVDFCRQMLYSPQNHMSSHKWFFTFFLRKYCSFQKICLIIKHPLRYVHTRAVYYVVKTTHDQQAVQLTVCGPSFALAWSVFVDIECSLQHANFLKLFLKFFQL